MSSGRPGFHTTDGVGLPPFRTGRLACNDANREVFFPPEGERGGPHRDVRVEAAKVICAGCDVKDACAEWAINNRIPDGIWGGLAEEDRKVIWDHDNAARAVAA